MTFLHFAIDLICTSFYSAPRGKGNGFRQTFPIVSIRIVYYNEKVYTYSGLHPSELGIRIQCNPRPDDISANL
jgi:hypothetical protein